MKVFEHGTKVNFVDQDNVVLGYDLAQDCCENADWFLVPDYKVPLTVLPNKEGVVKRSTVDLESYVFDQHFIHIFEVNSSTHCAVFKLVSETMESIYLLIYNAQNEWYYSHGFEWTADKRVLAKNYL